MTNYVRDHDKLLIIAELLYSNFLPYFKYFEHLNIFGLKESRFLSTFF